MSISVLKAGLQTTLQAHGRSGYRYFGMPWSGPADQLSMSLANRLVGNSPSATAIEMTLMGGSFEFHCDTSIAVTGAVAALKLSGRNFQPHATKAVRAGDVLEISPAKSGCRSYLAIAGELEADEFLGSKSTYLPAGVGGLEGRALKDGDRLSLSGARIPDTLETPYPLRPYFNDNFVLQVCAGPDKQALSEDSLKALFSDEFSATQRTSRMGCELIGPRLELNEPMSKPSSAVFPGTVQCPPEGKPYVLMSDAQTTGGYPHILQVIRSDRFQLGQIRPGAKVRFVERSAEDAAERLRVRWKAYSDWLSEPAI